MYDPDKTHWTVTEYLAGLRFVESGSIDGDYEAVNETSGAYGAYQLLPKYVDYLVTKAGQDPAEISDPAVQDIVAEWWARHYYAEFGNWDLVAVSWHAGASQARLALIQSASCTPGPAVTVDMIESAIEGESLYVERMRDGAASWRIREAQPDFTGLATVTLPAVGEFYLQPIGA